MQVDIQVLAHLVAAPAHGYDLKAKIGDTLGAARTPHNNVIYPALRALRDRGYIVEVSAAGTNRRTYTITEAGRAHLGDLLATIDGTDVEDDADFLTRVSLFALTPRPTCVELVNRRRGALEERRERLTDLLNRPAHSIWSQSVVHHNLRVIALELTWLDELDRAVAAGNRS